MKTIEKMWIKGFALVLLVMANSVVAETITDIAGREVTVPEKVNRILLGEGRLFYALTLLEGTHPVDRIVGWQGDFRQLDPQTYAQYRAKFPEIDRIPLIGGTTADSISAEKVLMLQPDIAIFGLAGHGPGRHSTLIAQLEDAGVPVVFVDFRTAPLKNTLPSIRLLGKMLHREAQAERYIAFYQQQLRRITDVTHNIPAVDKPSVFIELHAAARETCCSSAGKGNMGDFIDLAGGHNIARDLLPGPLGTVNPEQVIASEPQVYIASGGKAPGNAAPGIQLGAQVVSQQARESLRTALLRKNIRDLQAVKTGRTHAIWHNFYNSPYNILAIQIFAKWFYPDKFADLDVAETEKQLYQEFLAVPATGTFWISATQ